MLAGLPQKESRKPANSHLISCSNLVTPLDMAEPIVTQLKKLESSGVECYDALLQTTVLLFAPVILMLADNP